jgi:PII-like signaling protein
MLEVKLFFDTEDLYQNTPLYEHIMRYLMHHEIYGATLFTGNMGFGSHHHLHEPKRIAASDPVPVMIIFIDEEEKVKRVIPHLKEAISEGLLVAHKVERI